MTNSAGTWLQCRESPGYVRFDYKCNWLWSQNVVIIASRTADTLLLNNLRIVVVRTLKTANSLQYSL